MPSLAFRLASGGEGTAEGNSGLWGGNTGCWATGEAQGPRLHGGRQPPQAPVHLRQARQRAEPPGGVLLGHPAHGAVVVGVCVHVWNISVGWEALDKHKLLLLWPWETVTSKPSLEFLAGLAVMTPF